MNASRTSLLPYQSKLLLQRVLGGITWPRILITAFYFASLGWFADSIFNFLVALPQAVGLKPPMDPGVWWHLLLTLPFLFLTSLLVPIARQFSEQDLPFRITVDKSPRPAKALILFLSRPSDEELAGYAQQNGTLDDSDFLRTIEGKWRMPLEAIAYHRNHLREVIVLDSSGPKGSAPARQKFNSLLTRLWPAAEARIRDQTHFEAHLETGVDFFDPKQLVEVTDSIVRSLLRDGLSPGDIVIDITSGPKVATVAGGAVALAEGRRIQYIDTNTYEIQTFEPSWYSGEPTA